MAKQTTADRVTAALKAEGISGRKLAADLGKSVPYISRRLSGEVEFRESDLIAIATRLRIPVEALLSPERSAL